MNAGFIAYPILIIVGLTAVFFYVKNLIKATRQFGNKDYSIKLVLRAVGIFIPVIGVFMGLVR